jgi:hypothetical protein
MRTKPYEFIPECFAGVIAFYLLIWYVTKELLNRAKKEE